MSTRVTKSSSSARRSRAALIATALIAAVLSTLGGTASAAAAATGYVRLAHLSPDTPDVDVYLSSQSGTIREQVIRGVGYGALSLYQRLPVGGYTVAMRASGAAKSTPAVLTTQISVAAGGAYTVAGVGRYADLGLRVLNDDLSLPQGNLAKVRIVQASVRAPVLGVAVSTGANIVTNVAFATTTAYQLVQPGALELVVHPVSGGPDTNVEATLGEGSVYSLLVLDAPTGGLEARLTMDASRAGGVPLGGVNTGAGGTRQRASLIWLAAGGLALIALAVAALVLIYRRRYARVL